jgi:OmpA-OmpF porin, OOP family
MKKMSWTKVVVPALAVALGLIFSTAAFAVVDREGTLTLSPMIGGYVFEGNQHLDNGPAYGFAAGYNFGKNWGGELSFHVIDSHSDTEGDTDGYLLQLGGLYHFMPGKKLQPYVGAGSGFIVLDKQTAETTTRFLAYLGGGVEYFLTDNLALRGDVRYIEVFGTTNSNFMYTAGVTWYLGSARKIYENLVGTKPAPAPAPAPKEEAKAPAPAPAPAPVPAPPAPAPEAPAAKGETCIELRVEFDFDKSDIKPVYHDEIKKAADFLNEHPKAHGTIVGYTDAVGTDEYNTKLGMRRAEAVKKYLEDNFGIAPERLKTESMGKAQPVSTNLTEAGRAENRRAVRVFCSEGAEIAPPYKKEVCLGLKVEFESGKSEVRPQFKDEIKRVADYMKEHPDMTGTIEGYTDSVGSDQYNMKLSVKRAEAVKKYMVDEFGISKDRLKTKGMGKTRPIADNSTPEGRAMNRYAAEVICTTVEEAPTAP